MNEILVTLVDEVESLPAQVVELILAQFLRAAASPAAKQNGDEKQSTLMLKELPAAYKMAEYICKTCDTKMSRYIAQYFNDVILEITSTGAFGKGGDRRSSVQADSDDEDPNAGPSDSDLKELNKAHRLLKELWRASAAVLQNVIPQLDAELGAENIELRRLAVETLGDIISGIGAAGPPPALPMDAAAYPPVSVEEYGQNLNTGSILTTPMSPQSFAQAYESVYKNFLGRSNDKSPVIRAAWTTAIGRIISTSAGGIGLSREDEQGLINGLSTKLNDGDERVRIAAIRAVGGLGYKNIITKLASGGGIDKQGSVLASLADRCRDKKHHVRVEGLTLLAKLWGVASGDILAGNDMISTALERITSKILGVFYINDKDVGVLLDHALYEQLIPLSYPPNKSKASKTAESQTSQDGAEEAFDPDRVRVERILALVRSLDTHAKKAFFAIGARQSSYAQAVAKFVELCEKYNGGVMEKDDKKIKMTLTKIIEYLVSFLPDHLRATADLWKFAKIHDRRAYHLMKCIFDSDSDFKTVYKALREFNKRIEAAPGAPAGILETIVPLLYRSGTILHNRSNLKPIIEISRSDEKGLGATAHELLADISARNPQVFNVELKNLCRLLITEAPSEKEKNDAGAVKTLKATSVFARKNPQDFAKDRPFQQALIKFAKYSYPAKASKYAVLILLSTSDKKEMHAQELMKWAVRDWKFEDRFCLNKLAIMSQVTTMMHTAVEEFTDDVINITAKEILTNFRVTERTDGWVDDASLDTEGQAKIWAVKIICNRLRVVTDPELVTELMEQVRELLTTLVDNEGDLLNEGDTPKHHRLRLRLLAAQQLLKLSTTPLLKNIITPENFNSLATVAQDSNFHVRKGFIAKLQKYLVSKRLTNRFFAIVFLLAFEPDVKFKQMTMTWIRSQSKLWGRTTLESLLPRLLSLLAHHPDFSPEPTDLVDTAQYILFYVSLIANDENLGLIYKFAEKVKTVRDRFDDDASENLYLLSDLAQAIIRKWELKKGWTLQVYAGKVALTNDVFASPKNGPAQLEAANKNYLPEEMDELLDGIVKTASRKIKAPAKRKAADDADAPAAKKPRQPSASKTLKPAGAKKSAKPKTPAKKAKKRNEDDFEAPTSSVVESARRRSVRGSAAKAAYADRDSSDDDEEMWQGVSKWEYDDGRIEPDDADDASEASEDEDEPMADAEKESSVVPGSKEATPTPAAPAAGAVTSPLSTPEPEAEPEIEEPEEEDEPVISSPPKPRGKENMRRGRGAAKAKRTPTPEPEPAAKPSSKAKPVVKAKASIKGKAPIKAKPAIKEKALPTRTSGRGAKGKDKAVGKDVFDLDSD